MFGIKPTRKFINFFNQFNDFFSDQKENSDIRNCKYYNIDEIQSLNKLNDKHSPSLFHINSCPLTKNIEDLEFPLDSTQICFDVIAITETRISKSKFPITDINLTNYSYKYCPTESSAGGKMLYIGNHLPYKPKNDLCIYKTTELKSIFTELINTKKSNVIIGAIYRHPYMNLDEFNDIYLNPLLDKISKESQSIFLLDDFNVDLLKNDHHAPTNEFLDSLSSHMFLPHIIQPTRVTTGVFLSISYHW